MSDNLMSVRCRRVISRTRRRTPRLRVGTLTQPNSERGRSVHQILASQPATSHQPPVTSHQPPATSHQPPVTSYLYRRLVTTKTARVVSPPSTLTLRVAGEYLFSPRNDTT